MRDTLHYVARAMGMAWADSMLPVLQGDFPDEPGLLRLLALGDVAGKTRDETEREELVRTWISAAGERWREGRGVRAA